MKEQQKIHESNCDICGVVYHSETRNRRSKHGFPQYRVCAYCYDWTVPRKIKDGVRVMSGNPFPPPTSGKKFSKSWTKMYKHGKHRVERGEEGVKEENEPAVGVIEKTTEAVKDAVHVVETGVQGLLHGASEALSSLSPF